MRLDVLSNISGHQHGTDFPGSKWRYLFVQGADLYSLRIIQHRAIDCTWNMVIGELGGRAHIDDRIELGELC